MRASGVRWRARTFYAARPFGMRDVVVLAHRWALRFPSVLRAPRMAPSSPRCRALPLPRTHDEEQQPRLRPLPRLRAPPPLLSRLGAKRAPSSRRGLDRPGSTFQVRSPPSPPEWRRTEPLPGPLPAMQMQGTAAHPRGLGNAQRLASPKPSLAPAPREVKSRRSSRRMRTAGPLAWPWRLANAGSCRTKGPDRQRLQWRKGRRARPRESIAEAASPTSP